MQVFAARPGPVTLSQPRRICFFQESDLERRKPNISSVCSQMIFILIFNDLKVFESILKVGYLNYHIFFKGFPFESHGASPSSPPPTSPARVSAHGFWKFG